MSSSFELFSILISSNSSSGTGIFLPGDIISGYVFKLSSRILTKNVNITCRGKAFVSLDGHEYTYNGSSRLRFKGIQYFLPATTKEEYFLLSTVCLDEYLNNHHTRDDDDNIENARVCRPMLLQFHLRLPKVLPPSCTLSYGHLDYDILFEWEAWKAELDEWEHKVKRIPIRVGPCVNLNEIPFSGEPAQAARHEKFSFLCLSFGSIDVNLSVDKMGYVPGEELHFKVHINNETKFDVEKITVSLKQERTYYVGDLKKRSSKVLALCEGSRVPQGDSQIWEDFLIVPDDIPWKFFWPCSLVKVLFFLQVKLTTYKNFCNSPETIFENSINILIGDIPVDPEIYARNFGLSPGVQEFAMHRLYEPERVWLGVDCLSNGILAARAQQHTAVTNPVHRLSLEDSIPSYSSVVACPGNSTDSSNADPSALSIAVLNSESPPPSYQDAMRMWKPKSSMFRSERVRRELDEGFDIV